MTYPTEGHPALLRGGDVIIIGGGLVGLATGAALSARGADISIVADHNAGEASRAAAGMLAPSVERSEGPAHTFAVAAVQKGISLPALQRLLGHDRLTTTEIYLNLSPEDVIREFKQKW